MRVTIGAFIACFAALTSATAERPYANEDSAYTVEPGRFAVELTPVTYACRGAKCLGDIDSENWSYGYSLLRGGIATNTEWGIAFESWQHVRISEPESGRHENLSGAGCVALRLKQNLLGNDAGPLACAIAPYLRLPTGNGPSRLDRSEFGFSLPLEYALSEKWSALAAFYADWLANSDTAGRHFEASGLLNFTRTLTPRWSVFGEIYRQLRPETGASAAATLNAGVGCTFDNGLYVEVGALFGITRAADDFGSYVTFAKRF